ncbi:MAG: glycosyltransferase family 2 protein [Acholeplasmatales bacterium]|nr:glycosyltransferase family 2 protein [Acholeplasmatales bacterium]
MLLDIIIPQYKEDENIIKCLLDSIINQKNVDFKDINVTIVNDASDVKLSNKFLLKYKKLNICYVENEKNTGPGLARQKGVDVTDNKYIMFCDADDELYNDTVLSKIIEFIKKFQPNYLVTNIAVEAIVNNEKSLIIKKNRDTFPWMHGKVYKRFFLEDKKIRFCEHIRHVEDTYYTTCVIGSMNPNDIYYLDLITYKWKNNLSSLTRNKNKYSYTVSIFDDFFNAPIYTYDFLCKIKSYYRYSFLINSMFGIYIMLNSNLFDYKELKEEKEDYLNKLKEYLKTKRNIFVLVKKEELEKMFNEELKQLKIRNGVENISKSLDDFINEFITINKN